MVKQFRCYIVSLIEYVIIFQWITRRNKITRCTRRPDSLDYHIHPTHHINHFTRFTKNSSTNCSMIPVSEMIGQSCVWHYVRSFTSRLFPFEALFLFSLYTPSRLVSTCDVFVCAKSLKHFCGLTQWRMPIAVQASVGPGWIKQGCDRARTQEMWPDSSPSSSSGGSTQF